MKKQRTPEEMLVAARVPREEWPYELPEGWTWVRLGGITEIVGGGTPSSKNPEYYEDGMIPWIRPADLSGYTKKWIAHGQKNITELGLQKSSARIVPKNSVLLSTRAPIGYVAIAENEVCTNQGFKTFLPSPLYEPLYLYWFLKSNKAMLEQMASGTTFLELSAKRAAQIMMPLPPLVVQKKIVARLEKWFKKIAAAEKKIAAADEIFVAQKNALLHAAFSGTLTEEWRKIDHCSMNDWKMVTSQEVCEKITCGKTPKADIAAEGEIPYLKVYNIVDNEVAFEEHAQFIPREIHETKLKSSQLRPHDVIMNIVGPPLRKIAIIPDTYSAWNMNQAIVRFRPKEMLDYRFLYYQLLNPATLEPVLSATRGVVGQVNISVTQSRELQLKLPPMDEQREIVRRLDTLLSQTQRAAGAVREAAAAVQRLRAALLAKAFRGEV